MSTELLAKAARTKVGLSRCVVCGNKWAWCTCGGKTPFDCDLCQRGRGKGPKLGHHPITHKPVYGDRLCTKHSTLGQPARNRAEARQSTYRGFRKRSLHRQHKGVNKP